jgi:hypothetical protein
VTVQSADEGDTTSIIETAIAAAEQVEDAQADVDDPQPLEEIIADKGYHSIERSFAHLYDTGGMRRTQLRGHENILKRLLIHAGGFNLGLLVRSMLGIGIQRGFQGRLETVAATI